MKEKVVLITGGSRGIGKEIAYRFAKEGYTTLFTYKSSTKEAEEIKKEIENKYQVKCEAYPLDIKKENQIKSLVKNIIDTYQKIDVLVNNAGIDKPSFIEEKNKEDFMEILEVNLVGPFLLSKEIATHMLNQKKGKIINISSNNGINTNCPYTLEYDASKAALNSLTYNLSDLYAPYIKVNAVAPGWVKTDMMDIEEEKKEEFEKIETEKINIKRFACPDEIANLVYFLSTDNADYINREIIKIDGGFHG